MLIKHIREDIVEELETIEDWLSEIPKDEDTIRLENIKRTFESILEEIEREG